MCGSQRIDPNNWCLRLAAELKEKRKARSEKNRKKGVADGDAVTDQNPNANEVSTLPEKSRSRKRKGRQIDTSDSGEELAGKVVGSVMLDESVVHLIRAREKYVFSISNIDSLRLMHVISFV